MNRKKILIVAGEPSGDLYASNLIADLKNLNPDLEFFGIGGNLSRRAGSEIIFDISKLALVGVIEVLKNISTVGRAYKGVLSKIDSTKTDLAILVDYPGFNLGLAKALKARNIPIIYYISPQVWAWGSSRINIIRKYVEKIIVFFKFEEKLYKEHGVNAEFVGHPLLDIVKITVPKDKFLEKYGFSKEKTTIALLPGSRAIEVKALLSILISSCKIIQNRLPKTQFLVAKHLDLPMALYEAAVKNAGLEIRIASGETYDVLAASDFALIASGTATLESAIVGTPFVIVYKANFFTYLLYKLVARLPFIGLVNVISNKKIVPEFLQYDATPEKIANNTLKILGDKNKLASMAEDLKAVKSSLGSPGASPRAARSILPFLN